jgi:hypothetical protein
VEKDQFEQNRQSLILILEQITKEIEQETAIIQSEFANPTSCLFHLAITYLIPQKLAT